jgi:hypothetical protein
VLEALPYPIAHLYRRALDRDLRATARCATLDATVYELLRVVGLSLVSQYLRESRTDAPGPRDNALEISRAVTALQSPSFNDWILLARTIARHLPRVVERPLFPRLGPALEAVGTLAERPVALRGVRRLGALEAVVAAALRLDARHPWAVMLQQRADASSPGSGGGRSG